MSGERDRTSELAERIAYLEGVIEQQNTRIKQLNKRVLDLETKQ